MPAIRHDHLSLHYEIDGPDKSPCLILSNALGTSLDIWEPQLPVLSDHFKLLRYDGRGHGRSGVASPTCTVSKFGEDVIALMDHAGIERAHFCGVALGGMVGLWLASHHPSRIERLIVSNTAALLGPSAMWDARIQQVRAGGVEAIAPAVIERWFTRDFQQHATLQVSLVRSMLLATSASGYIAACNALRDADLRDLLHRIVAPTLVLGGRYDKTTSPAQSRQLADHIPTARYVELNAAHLMNWEVAQSYTKLIEEFLLN